MVILKLDIIFMDNLKLYGCSPQAKFNLMEEPHFKFLATTIVGLYGWKGEALKLNEF